MTEKRQGILCKYVFILRNLWFSIANETLYQEIDTWKKNHGGLQLENQKLTDRISVLEDAKANMDKKKSKAKELEEMLTTKLEAKKTELAEIKSTHAKEVAQLTKSVDEMKEKVSIHLRGARFTINRLTNTTPTHLKIISSCNN